MEQSPCTSNASQGSTTPKLGNTVQLSPGSSLPSSYPITPKSARKQVAAPKESPNTPKSSKSRHGWTPVIIKDRGHFEILIFCKQTTGKVGPYTDCAPNSKHRVAWSPVSECEVVKLDRKADVVEVVRFKNTDNILKEFRCDLLNMFIRSSSKFDRFCTKLQIEKKFQVLCKYLTLLAHSKDFSCYREEEYTEDGFLMDGSGIQEESLNDGGSVAEYLQFKTLAQMDATVVSEKSGTQAVAGGGGSSKIPSRVAQNKRITEFFQSSCPPKKLSKMEEVDVSFAKECADKSGLEKRLTSEYVGWGSISIDKLKCNDGVSLSINQQKVGFLAESLMKRFDPSLAVLLVVEDAEGNNGEYFVLHGNHLLCALKQLDTAQHFEELPGIVDRELQCYVVGAGCRADPALGVYCQIRSNDLAAEVKTDPELHELIFVFNDLNKSYKDVEKSKMVMERLAKLRKVSRDDRTSFNKIFAWPQDKLTQLIEVLKVYEVYQTLDGSGTRNRKRIQQGLKLPLTGEMLKNLGKCEPDLFGELHQSVLAGEMSLRDLLVNSSKTLGIEKTKAIISKEAGYETLEHLQNKYPDKLTDKIVQGFSGVVMAGKKKNPEADRLKSFVKNLPNQLQPQEEPIKFEILSDDRDIKVEAFDTVVVQVGKDDMEFVESLIKLVYASQKDMLSVMVILDSEKNYMKTLQKLACWEEQPRMKVCSVYFQRQVAATLSENLTFSIIFGRFFVFNPPLKSFHRNIETSLKDIIANVSPPAAQILFVTRQKRFCAMIHEESNNEDSFKITYLAPQVLLDKFRLKSLVNSVFDEPEEGSGNTEDLGGNVGDESVNNEESKEMSSSLERQSSTSSTKYNKE